MNLFFLDPDLQRCAEAHVDRHVVKIITEANQCMACAYPKGVAPYRHSYTNHPMTVWVRTNLANFNWTVEYCLALCYEYTYRYGRVHAGERVANWYKQNPPTIPNGELTEPPRCFGAFKDQINITTSVYDDYRSYYKVGKSHLFNWKNRATPSWLL